MAKQEIRIRTTIAEDLEEIARLETQIFTDAWSYKALEESLEQEYVTILTAVEAAEAPPEEAVEENIVGYLICYRMINEGNIVRVAVDPLARRKGTGRRLMEEILLRGEQLGLTEYSLEVRVSNEPAIALYRAFGFETEGCRKRYYSDPVEDGNIMWRR